MGNFLKNTSLLSPDTVIFDSNFDNSIGHTKKVISEVSSPNNFRTKKYFYGEFIEHVYPDGLGAVSGDLLFDDFLASLRVNEIGGTSDADFKPFLCVVNVPELTGVITPPPDDPDRLLKIEKIIVNLGIFKSYNYIGQTPEPGQTVAVSFSDTHTFSDPIFEFPLKGAALGDIQQIVGGGDLNGGSSKSVFGSCGKKGGSDCEDPRKQTKKPKAQKVGAPAPAPTPKAQKSKPKKPSKKKTDKEVPSSKKGKKALPKCNRRGRTILWKTSGKEPPIQVQAFGSNALFGLDISGWNSPKKIKPDVFKKNGVDFIIIKLTQGTSTSNKFIVDQMKELRNSGILLAPYHFSSAQHSRENNFKRRAQKEIDIFSREIDKHFGGKPDLTPSIDFESGHGGRKHPKPYGLTARGHNLNVRFHLELARILKRRYGKRPLVYTANWARGSYFSKADPELLAEFGSETFVWWAEYARGSNSYLTSGPVGGKGRSFRPWPDPDIWQFSGSGQFEDLYKQKIKASFDFNAMKRSKLSKLRL
tara:strand:+ start:127 stop:1716 length:1590 start_codon:yes stop_codon:yes gene_type:complete